MKSLLLESSIAMNECQFEVIISLFLFSSATTNVTSSLRSLGTVRRSKCITEEVNECCDNEKIRWNDE